ncbi:MAG: pSer/pThr/pTyr-binding forkhead associated (FHA) protein [Akkermansiaceae bacterium]|jgi:pSer/pThr/pTyr-binding forkhead associated (FHA) protein
MPRVAITIPGKNPQPYRFQIDRKKVTVGRASDNDIIIDCSSVSSLHCTMERVEGGYILRDRHSTNGITLDQDDMAVIDLRNDNEVRVGDVKFEYTLSNDELDELDDEEFVPHAQKTSDDSNELEVEKKPKVGTPVPRPATPVPVLASSSSDSSFLYGLALFVCGILSFYAGLDHSYSGKQRNAGRGNDVSLLKDMTEGRPPLSEAGKEEEIK